MLDDDFFVSDQMLNASGLALLLVQLTKLYAAPKVGRGIFSCVPSR